MKPLPLAIVVREVGVWVALLLVAALLTVVFNILGAITAAVFTGLIMGAARRWKWQVLPVSLIFPVVGLTLAQAAKADLDPHQRLSVPALCFGAFWGIYLLTLVLVRAEQNDHVAGALSRPGCPTVPAATGPLDGASTALRGTSASSSPAEAVTEAAAPLTLGDLQGTWCCQSVTTEASPQRRSLEIVQENFALRTWNPAGVPHLACGRVRVAREAEAIEIIVVPALHAESATAQIDFAI